MWRVYVTVRDRSVCPSVCPIYRPLQQRAASLLLWARRAGDIDRLLHGRRSAASAISATLSADARSWTQTCLLCYSAPVGKRSVVMSMHFCLFVYLSVCLSVWLFAPVSQEPYVWSLPNSLHTLPIVMAQSSGSVAVRYVVRLCGWCQLCTFAFNGQE